MNGWKLVPVEPTEEMLNVLHDRVLISVNSRKREANILNDKAWWAAVVAAAPPPPARHAAPVAVVNVERPGNIEWLAEPTPDDGASLYAVPQPPALGGEPEVLGYSVKGNRYAIRLTKGELLELYEGYSGDALIELVDRAHVARLQAEVERLTNSLANHDTAAKCMTAWVAEKGQMPWATAIKMLAVLTKMPDAERDQLLGMDDGSTERGALIAERDKAQDRTAELEGLLRTCKASLQGWRRLAPKYKGDMPLIERIDAALAEGAKS